jgi:NAD(P)H dehydrogenase (quinone)
MNLRHNLVEHFGNETAKEIANIYRFIKDYVEHLEAKDLRTNTRIQLPVELHTFDTWASQIAWI